MDLELNFLSYLRNTLTYLLNMNEILGLHLVSLHNLSFYLNLMSEIRIAVGNGSFAEFKKSFTETYRLTDKDEVI